MADVPSFLKDYAEAYAEDPRAACLRWFRDAKYGLFLHYGLYALLGRHEWGQFRPARCPTAPSIPRTPTSSAASAGGCEAKASWASEPPRRRGRPRERSSRAKSVVRRTKSRDLDSRNRAIVMKPSGAVGADFWGRRLIGGER